MRISREIFDEQRRPRFGMANPERMHLAFWEWMIRGDDDPLTAEGGALAQLGLTMRAGVLKSGYGPYRARDLFQVPLNRDDGPIWTFDRMGQTRTELPDGRVICVGGEHEDSYDPDFCIYNDVVVFGPADQIEIYGYPKPVFPPTDFHTASLIGDRVIIIGCLGYTTEPCEDWSGIRFVVQGVPVSVTVGVSEIDIIVEGELPGEMAGQIAEEVRTNTEVRVAEAVERRTEPPVAADCMARSITVCVARSVARFAGDQVGVLKARSMPAGNVYHWVTRSLAPGRSCWERPQGKIDADRIAMAGVG